MPAIVLFLFLSVSAIVGWRTYSWVVKREREMREFAEQQHLFFIGDDVPDVPSEILDWVTPSRAVKNCVHGWLGGEQAIAFDYSVGWGRNKYWRTAIALEQNHPRDVATRYFASSFRHGRWCVAKGTSNFFSFILPTPSEIAHDWRAMQTATEEERVIALNRVVPGDVVIRPRHERPR